MKLNFLINVSFILLQILNLALDNHSSRSLFIYKILNAQSNMNQPVITGPQLISREILLKH